MFKVLGTTDEITTCDCCGRKNLKCTVALDKDGEIVHYGRDCAGAAVYGRKSAKNTSVVEFWAKWVAAARCMLQAGQDAIQVSERLVIAGIHAEPCGDEVMIQTPQGWVSVTA
jgi:hypothetical protein